MRPLAEILGESPGIVAICEQVERLLKHQPDGRRLPPILLQGETGTGKGMLAHALHRAGPRRDGPFVDVNCAAIPESLLEAEMFGYERGAFTDARQAKPGLFRVAHRGTIFLDEVGLMPEVLQGKLLKVIEERSVRRLGGIHTEPVDVWIITANNGDLLATARERRFREDLYHRLAVLTLWLPALRERGRDVVLLAEHFLRRACADYELPAKELDPSAHAALLGYPWPGNVRELANVMERVALLSEAPLVTKEMLGLPEPAPPRLQEARRPEEARPQREPDGTERERLLAALRKSDWNLSRAAARLGLARNTLRYRMEKYGLDRATETALVAEPPRTATPVSVRPPAPTRGAGSVRWEARRLTFLHAVLVDPATGESRRASRGLEVIAEKTEAFGGRVEDRGPSELTAAFGLDAIEDAPRRAAHAAMAMLKATERARDAGAEARVKLAIHVAQVLVGHGGATPEVDPQAKRETWAVLEELLAYSEDDTIVVTDTAAPFLERHFALIPVAADDSVRSRV